MAVRNPLRGDSDTATAAHAVRRAIAALEQATRDAQGHRVLADLLSMTDERPA